MRILAIETSCDDTCVAILDIKDGETSLFKILSNIISSQVKLHAKYGGIYPFMAKREHQRNLPIVFKKALKKAKNPKINLIAVTVGPGLEPCLWVGVNFAKDLSQSLNLPLVPVNHIEAHILANFIGKKSEIRNRAPSLEGGGEGEEEDEVLFAFPKSKISPKSKILNSKHLFPAICLVVSGGHTQLILMKNVGNYKILGETRDDAAGECFDKVARILGLGYPGGPAIAAEAAKFKISNLKFKIILPRPMIYQKNYDFSFSGLKTAVLYQNQKSKIKGQRYKQAMCAETQQAVIDVLIHKILRAAKDYKVKTIILGGGVAANKELRKQFKQKIKKEIPNSLFLIPDSKFCTDNAAMVAAAAYFNWKKEEKTKPKNIEANANQRI